MTSFRNVPEREASWMGRRFAALGLLLGATLAVPVLVFGLHVVEGLSAPGGGLRVPSLSMLGSGDLRVLGWVAAALTVGLAASWGSHFDGPLPASSARLARGATVLVAGISILHWTVADQARDGVVTSPLVLAVAAAACATASTFSVLLWCRGGGDNSRSPHTATA